MRGEEESERLEGEREGGERVGGRDEESRVKGWKGRRLWIEEDQ